MSSGFLRQFAKALKIVLVGDADVGKSWLLLRAHNLYDQCLFGEGLTIFEKKAFEPPEIYSPTDLKTYVVNVETPVLGNYQTKVCDAGGRSLHDSIRPLAYFGAHVVMLCFDVTNRESFRNITQRWLPEIQRYHPSVQVLIVGTKSDLRTHSCDPNNTVLLSEALSIAKKVNSLYHETSAKSGDQVDKAFECAVQLGHMARKQHVKQTWWRSNPHECVDSLFIPSASPSPAVAVDPSTFDKDFVKILSDSTYADVLFSFEDGSPSVTGHRIVLCLRPSAFKDVFQDQSVAERFIELFEIVESCNDPACKDRTWILLKSWISRQTFNNVLKFLYTGIPDISKDSDENEIKGLLIAAEKLEIDYLVGHCNYVLQLKTGKDGKLNKPKHGTRDLPEPAHRVQGVFLNKLASLFSDVTFLVNGTLVFAHRAIVVGRSHCLAALFSDNYIDGKASEICLHGVDCAAFLAVMEYLYTDNCSSLSEVPVEDVLILADRLCLSRLVQMCEVRMRDEFQQMAQTQNCRDLLENVLDILEFSTVYNAQQLKKWCLHFIATNHTAFEATALKKELELLVSQNKVYFEEHRWPPESCVTSLQNSKRRGALIPRCKPMGCSPYKCSVM